MAELTPDLHSIHSRVLQHADKLFGALVDLGASQRLTVARSTPTASAILV